MISLHALAVLSLLVSAEPPRRETNLIDPVLEKLHPFLRVQIDGVGEHELVPAYVSMRDKLGYEHFRARVLRMNRETRRETVVRELREHMQQNQERVFEYLSAESAAGNAILRSRNFLGNFIRLRATASVLRSVAAFEEVGYLRFDHAPAREAVEDSAKPMQGTVAGNGPRDIRADEVWATGIVGQGLVWMNADSGVRADANSPIDVHPGLTGRLWTNPGELPGNNIDDDLNGFVDDYFGWNFRNGNERVEDNGGHGTRSCGVMVGTDHISGDTLGNCPGATVMSAKMGGEVDQWDAIQYAVVMGAHGLTSQHSYKLYFMPPPDYAMHRDVSETSLAVGLVRTNSVSNDGSACSIYGNRVRRPFNIAAPASTPSPWHAPAQTLLSRIGGVLAVGGHEVGVQPRLQPRYSACGPFAWSFADLTQNLIVYPTKQWDDQNDDDYPWSGGTQQGLLKPDLTGPMGTRTTTQVSAYAAFSGTSNAAASVAGCLALALSANPSLSPEDLAMAAKTSAVDQGPPGYDDQWGAGSVDAWELTKLCRALHRVNGDVAHTVEVAASSFDPTGYRLELDSIPNTTFWLFWGSLDTRVQIEELTARIADGFLVLTGTTDANGNYVIDLPVFPALAGFEILSQFWIVDPLFGDPFAPITGSNSVRARFVP